MTFLAVFLKSALEQLRSYWILLLTLSMGPFFILVYYLIVESTTPHYSLLLLNQDQKTELNGTGVSYGDQLAGWLESRPKDSQFPMTLIRVQNRDSAVSLLKDRAADALIILDSDFSATLAARIQGDTSRIPHLEFSGDLTRISYLVSAVWAGDLIQQFILETTHTPPAVTLTETALGTSAKVSEFDLVVPGLLIVALIMLMFTSSIAFVAEAEHKTMIRLKLSRLKAWEYLAGVGLVQVAVGLVSVLLTLAMAILLGFQYGGSVLILILVAGITSISIIAFSLLIAAATRSATEVLIAGNFPMFLFMFFTGAAFPMTSDPWFTLCGVPVNVQALMTPTHAISALNKTLILDAPVSSIFPELGAILILTVIYLVLGGLAFKKRHMGLTE